MTRTQAPFPCAVFFFVTESGVRELVGEVAVIRHQDETFAFEIKAAHGVDMLRGIHQVTDRLTSIAALRAEWRAQSECADYQEGHLDAVN